MDLNTITAYATVALVFVTALYALLVWRTLVAIQQQRMDQMRPLVVPVVPGKLIARLGEVYEHAGPETFLQVGNIGAGPAVNIRARLHWQNGEAAVAVLPTIEEARTWIRDLAPKDEANVYEWAEPTFQFQQGLKAILVLAYDDAFGRHFESTYERWGEQWVLKGHREVNERQIRTIKDTTGL